MEPRSQLESEIFELWKELSPSAAFAAGLDGYSGRFFIPSEDAVNRMLDRIRDLRNRAEDGVQRKLLASLERGLLFDEPQTVVGDALGTFFDHMVKEGINPQHMLSLADSVEQALDAFLERVAKKEWSIGIKVLTIIRCNGFLELLKTIQKETKDEILKQRVAKLQAKVKDYRRVFAIKGVREASFEEVYRLLKQDLGRSGFYSSFLKEAFDYLETPEEVEAKGLRWLKADLPKLKRLARKLAKIYKVKPEAKAIKEAIKKKSPVKYKQLVEFMKELRKRAQPWVHRVLVRVNPQYDTRVIETPPYLTGMMPTGAVSAYNYITRKPFQIFFVTTDPKKDPPTGLADLMQLILHEEYGHCVNFSNSAVGYVARPSLAEMLGSFLVGPITEGFAFYLEKEFAELFNALVNGKDKTQEGKELLDFVSKYTDPMRLAVENEFIVLDFAITRYLRVIGDARINSGKQTLFEFVEWASKKTGLSRSRIYHQIFPAHEGIAPGYATCYAIVGERIRELKNKAVKKGKNFVEFNTYACGIGFPARTLFEERLNSFIAS